MRRIALILGLLATVAVTVAATAGADDKRSYQAELFNAFGVVKGSELRIAGVKAGTITDLDVTPEKLALVSFEVGPGFPELKADASCSSEPQSLIAEYFLDCQPGTSDQPLEGPIAAANNQTTVQNDLVNNTLREPFKRRFQLIINEFGTALTGNAENLNAAIRSGAPALRELGAVLKILGRQNTIIAQLNADSDTIFEQLTARREQVVDFIDEAEDTARVSAERRDDLSRDFDLLDDFLFELQPVMVELGNLAREQTPLLTDLHAAAPGLNKLAKNLPAFNDGSRVSLKSLGRAAIPGRQALASATEEIAELNRAGAKAQPAADVLATFLEDLDDPRRAVEESASARTDLCGDPGESRASCAGADTGEADRRVQQLEQRTGADLDHPGVTGLEGLLNYGYIQPLSLNLFNDIGHALHLNLVGASSASEGGGECGHTSEGPDYPHKVPGDGSVRTTNVANAPYCAALLGDSQPGINVGVNPADGDTTFGLPPYHPSVCPLPDPQSGVGGGSTNHSICDPLGPVSAGFQATAQPQQTQPGAQAPTQPGAAPKEISPKKLREILGLPPKAPLPKLPNVPNVPVLPNLPALPSLPGLPGLGGGGTPNSSGSNLLGFLLGP
jgi:ABC-type transporter Mla subunit MlaD